MMGQSYNEVAENSKNEIINKIVHGHIHNYNDMTLVHGHLHDEAKNTGSGFKHFEFINLNNNNQNYLSDGNEVTNDKDTTKKIKNSPVYMAKSYSETDFDMFLDDCDCNPQVIEICCENDSHEEHNTIGITETENKQSLEGEDKDIFQDSLATTPALDQIQKDLLFLDDCNLENKELSKDVVMNFLDITKMYDIPILNKTHGKIVAKENLLKTGLPSGNEIKTERAEKSLSKNSNGAAHHHHKLEIHSHGRHTHDQSKTYGAKSHFMNCGHDFECAQGEEQKTGETFKDENFLHFNWNEQTIDASSQSFIHCKWDGCHQKFKTTMELQSHLIGDHLGNGDCKHSKNKNVNLKAGHKQLLPHSHIEQSITKTDIVKQEFEEECFWDQCHFETFDICQLVDHINSTHGINFNMKVNGRNDGENLAGSSDLEVNGLPLKRVHSHRHAELKLVDDTKTYACRWDNCTDTFTLSADLDLHLKGHLPKRLPSYDCRWRGCDKHFKQRQKLERHMKSHSGYKEFQCSLCQKYFSTSDILLQHKRKVHNKSHGHAAADCVEKPNILGLS